MKRIELKNGYADVPDNWIYYCLDNPMESEYLHVIEARCADSPHIYFASKDKGFGVDEENEIYSRIASEHPWFKYNYVDKQVEAVFENVDGSGRLLNVKEWNAAPTLCIFRVNDADIQYAIYPYGVKVYKLKD